MVTGSKKPEASATKVKAVTAKPKATAKAKTTASETAASKTQTSKPKKTTTTAKPKTSAKPKASAKTQTSTAKPKPKPNLKAAIAPRRVGEMVYNDELLESMAEMILYGSKADLTPALPEIKKQLFDYDIYMVSFLSDGEIGEIGGKVAELSGADAADLTARLLTIRESARAFVAIACKHNSVRAFIDRAIEADGKEAGISRLKEAFLTGEYCIADVDPATCEGFLMLF
ncbi:hypothetical protein [Methanocella arvoryzae]|nr:hypothetical protein [Methanocella arvoryzae]